METAEVLTTLQNLGEHDLARHFSKLTKKAQERFSTTFTPLSIETLKAQKEFLKNHLDAKKSPERSFDPLLSPQVAVSEERKAAGQEWVAKGRVGCLLVAGGQGTRLGFDRPKGTFPLTIFKRKSLFQIFAEKTIAAGKLAEKILPLAIMTSPQNHTQTVDFFIENDNFGLKNEQLFFFQQNELPFLNEEGNLILLEQEAIAKGPAGNGCSLECFVKSGIWEKWKERGIEYVNYILVDNVLADPYDAELVGFHTENGNDVSIKCIEKNLPNEQAGILVRTSNGIEIVEYSEISEKENLNHRFVNSGLYCLNMEFIKNASLMSLPWHLAYKSVNDSKKFAWKFETFIFDTFKQSKKTGAILYPREACFAPLKNLSGENSPEKVQEALLLFDLHTLENLIGYSIETSLIELDPEFYYPTPQMQNNWKDRAGPFFGYLSP